MRFPPVEKRGKKRADIERADAAVACCAAAAACAVPHRVDNGSMGAHGGGVKLV